MNSSNSPEWGPTQEFVNELVSWWFHRVQNTIPAFAYCIWLNGKPFLEGGFGYANPDSRVRIDSNTLIPATSITKFFTASMLHRCYQQTELRPDTDLGVWLGIPKLQGVTVDEAVSHSNRGDIGRTLGGSDTLLYTDTPAVDERELLRQYQSGNFEPQRYLWGEVKGRQQLHAPRHAYSNDAAILLGFAMAKAWDCSVESVKRRMVSEMKWERSRFDWTPQSRREAARLNLISPGPDRRVRASLPYQRGDLACGLKTTLDEMCKAAGSVLLPGGEHFIPSPDNPDMHVMTRVVAVSPDDSEGVGRGVIVWPRENLVGHFAAQGGSRTMLLVDASQRLVVTCVGTSGDPEITRMSFALTTLARRAIANPGLLSSKETDLLRTVGGLRCGGSFEAIIGALGGKLAMASPTRGGLFGAMDELRPTSNASLYARVPWGTEDAVPDGYVYWDHPGALQLVNEGSDVTTVIGDVSTYSATAFDERALNGARALVRQQLALIPSDPRRSRVSDEDLQIMSEVLNLVDNRFCRPIDAAVGICEVLIRNPRAWRARLIEEEGITLDLAELLQDTWVQPPTGEVHSMLDHLSRKAPGLARVLAKAPDLWRSDHEWVEEPVSRVMWKVDPDTYVLDVYGSEQPDIGNPDRMSVSDSEALILAALGREHHRVHERPVTAVYVPW